MHRLTRFAARSGGHPTLLVAGCWVVVCACLAAGCSTASYRRSADKEAYGLVHLSQERVLGETNAFTIDTPYSARKPQEIAPTELIEDRLQTNDRVLTIEAAIDLAVASSREYQTAKETLFRAALTLSNTRYVIGDSVVPSSGAVLAGARTSGGQQSASASVENELVFTKLFRTGGRLTVGLLNNIMLYYSGRPELSFSRGSAGLVQPLLRNFGKNNVDVEALTQVQRNLAYAVRTFSLYQDQFTLGIVNNYFRLLQQKDTVRNQYANYLGRVQSTKRLEARAVDREKLADVDQARQAELSAKNSYVDAVANYRTLLDQFKLTLGRPLGERLFLDDRALDEVEKTGLVPAQLDADSAYHLATQKQLQMLTDIDQFEDAKRRVRLAADLLKPGLTLTANATLNSEGTTDYTRFNGNQVAADAALQLTLPVDRVPLANAYRAALINFETSIRTFTAQLDTLKSSIENGLRTLAQRRQNYQIQKNALQLADRRVESTTLLLEAGRAEVRDLVDSQNSQIDAQNAVTSALVDYQQSRLQLMLDIGALRTELPDFWLKDHLAAFLPDQPDIATPSRPTEQAILPPPDRYFEK